MMLLRIFDLIRKSSDFHLLLLKLIIQSNHIIGQFWHLRDVFFDNLKLSLTFLELKVDHTDALLSLTDLLLSILQDVLLNV
jgi:hypothetical protein